ncbi:MAG: hypothetical protein J5739_03695 [Lachnospiraceae bacterium]|nr:hypothetical protein [Lachnospiraceae bacterium]
MGLLFLKINHLGKLEKVYSIWLCFNCSVDAANTISCYRIVHDPLHGSYGGSARYDLISVVMVRLPGRVNHDLVKNPPTVLHRLLYDLMVNKISVEDKIELLKNEYGLHFDQSERRVDIMCNLSDMFFEDGIEEGIERVVTSMLRKNKSLEEISELCELSIDTVEKIRDKMLNSELVAN